MVSTEPSRSRINDAIDRLTDEFRDRCSAETVHDLVAASFEAYRGSRIADFVPLLVYRSARDQLGALAKGREYVSPGNSSS